MIQFDNVFFQYPGSIKETLHDINLHVKKGAILGLIGPNGAGKTTLISLLTGGLVQTKGRVTVAGKKLPESIKSIKQITGYTPQDYAFYPNLSALENLEFFSGIQGLKGKNKSTRIDYCLEFCQLDHVASQLVAEFSGGLKRRLNIAIGLLTDPEILIFDEPTVNIDPQSRAFILQQIKELQSMGKTIIYTSHYMEEVEKICDCLAIIDHGRLLKNGSLSSIQDDQDLQLTIEYSGELNESDLVTLEVDFQLTADRNKLIFGDVDVNFIDQILSLLQEKGISITDLHFGKSNLEQIFLELTSRQLRD